MNVREKSCGKAGSMVPAVASAALFSLAELAVGASADRAWQLLTAAALLMVLAAVHTHAVLGTALSGWRLFQPFRGGACFCVLQTCGWTGLAYVGAAALLLVLQAWHFPGFASSLGVAQLVAQVALVISLTHFESVHAPHIGDDRVTPEGSKKQSSKTKARKKKSIEWTREGVPISVVFVIMFTLAVFSVGVMLVAAPSRQALGWTLLVASLLAQAAGLRMMWTLTWDLGAICAYLLESQEALAVMACMGIGSINFPWYIGRTLFHRRDLTTRAMIGLSQWATDDLLPPSFGLRGHYIHDVALGWIRVAFALLDTALHIVPGSLLLQHCAKDIRAIHVLFSILLTAVWFGTLFLRYMVIDWQQLWRGRLLWKRWGNSSLYEPMKVAHIYQFYNSAVPRSLVPQDGAFLKSAPGFITLILLGHILTAMVATSPRAGDMFFAAGFGHLVSDTTLAISIPCLLFGGAMAGVIGFVRFLVHKARFGTSEAKAQ